MGKCKILETLDVVRFALQKPLVLFPLYQDLGETNNDNTIAACDIAVLAGHPPWR